VTSFIVVSASSNRALSGTAAAVLVLELVAGADRERAVVAPGPEEVIRDPLIGGDAMAARPGGLELGHREVRGARAERLEDRLVEVVVGGAGADLGADLVVVDLAEIELGVGLDLGESSSGC